MQGRGAGDFLDDAFCSIEKLSETIFCDTEKFMLVYDKFPVVRGHILIIPKRHVEDITALDGKEWEDLKRIMDKALPIILERYSATARSYNIAVQTGPESGREISHLHIHIVPRNGGDRYKASSMALYRDIAERQSRSSGVEEEVKALRKLFRYKTGKQ